MEGSPWSKSLQVLKKYNLLIPLLCLFSCENKHSNSIKENTVALIDGEAVLMNQLDILIQDQLYESLYGVYYKRRIALEELIAQKLLTIEALDKGLSKDSLIQFIKSDNSEYSLEQFIRDNSLLQGIPDKKNPFKLLALDSQEGQQLLDDAYQQKLLEIYLDNLKIRHNVINFLKAPLPPQVTLEGLSTYSFIARDPKTEVVIVIDLDCPICQEKLPLFEQLYKSNRDNVTFSIAFINPQLTLPILISDYSYEAGKFWEFQNLLIKAKPKDSVEHFKVASEIGLDKQLLINHFYQSNELKVKLINNNKILTNASISSTPTLLIDNRVYYGELTQVEIQNYIDEFVRTSSGQ